MNLLHSALMQRGIRCWLDVRDMDVGAPILDAVYEAVADADKVLLCCSENSLSSSWAKDEIAFAIQKERQTGKKVLVPLNLDGTLFSSPSAKAAKIREPLAANFEGWSGDPMKIENEVPRLVRALRIDEPLQEFNVLEFSDALITFNGIRPRWSNTSMNGLHHSTPQGKSSSVPSKISLDWRRNQL